jgi:hypothetical protein
MILKEAINEIEKRYKKGDVIPCIIEVGCKITYTHWGDLNKIAITDNEVFIKKDRVIVGIMKQDRWSAPIREKESLWGFFESVKDEYPNLAEEYLRECGEISYVKMDSSYIDDSFSWSTSKAGHDYWDRISDLSKAYFKED